MSPTGPFDAPPDPEEAVVIEILDETKPLPPETFRGELAQRLAEEDPGWGPRPEHLWPQALGLITVGIALLVIGALISAGGT
jgi:hypothetical protein